jgi:GNAT superfamily N-acetyltransferase
MADHPASPDASVRPARPQDAAAVAALTVHWWRRWYAEVIAPEDLAALTPEALAEQWRESIATPPSPAHRVLVALAGNQVVGYAVTAPDDENPDSPLRAELSDLLVDADHLGQGHASRLLAASVDLARADGVTELTTWCLSDDKARQGFLEAAGFGPDGLMRHLDMGEGTAGVDQRRLVTSLG